MTQDKLFVAQWGILGCGCELRSLPTLASQSPQRASRRGRWSNPPPSDVDWTLMLGISSKFASDLTLSPLSRGANVSHAIAAVGSRNVAKAEEFINEFCPEGGAAQVEGLSQLVPRAYGSYAEVVNDPVGVA